LKHGRRVVENDDQRALYPSQRISMPPRVWDGGGKYVTLPAGRRGESVIQSRSTKEMFSGKKGRATENHRKELPKRTNY